MDFKGYYSNKNTGKNMMCGILFTNDPAISSGKFTKALDVMKHRGIDAQGEYHANNSKLGHNRLSVLDLNKRSNQPFCSDDGTFAIIFNGEIYNYRELAKEHGIQTRTTSDTEVLLALFLKFGHRMLSFLNGMFTLIILNVKTGDIFIARDRLGIKPLYMCKRGKKLYLSSEIASLLKLTGTPEFDEIGLRQYRKLRTFFNGRTIYSGIEMFPAGHYMLNGKITRYWELPREEQEPPEYDELKELIKSAVDYRMIADVPVGNMLSGGLDSSVITHLNNGKNTWCIGFEDNNEFEYAELIADVEKRNHRNITVDKHSYLDLAKKMIVKRKEPLSVMNEVLIYKLSKHIKYLDTVVLCGEGADELFFGYDRIFRWAENNDKFDLEQFSERYSYGSHDDLEIVEDAIEPFMDYGRSIDIVAAFFQIAHLHGLLVRLDYATMQSTIEARVPFVDHRLVERMAGVPFDFRMKNDVVKHPLKHIFRDDLPEEIINRGKVAFPVEIGMNFEEWVNFNLDTLMESKEQIEYYV